jgi:hypothetical protein
MTLKEISDKLRELDNKLGGFYDSRLDVDDEKLLDTASGLLNDAHVIITVVANKLNSKD